MATMTSTDRLRVLGVRHHGPGSARAVRRALEEFRPEVVLIEGPPEADRLVGLLAEESLLPPVALLAYAPDNPGIASFWPLAVFSPEWQAMRWAVDAGVPVRFCDLPAATVLAAPPKDRPTEDGPEALFGDIPELPGEVRTDPIAVLARTAGYDDPERWWDDVMELRSDGDPFDAITEAMAALRTEDSRRRSRSEEVTEQRREAHMRKILRAELKLGRRVAVVCGAWHAPALTGKLPPVSADAAVLKGLPKRRVALTWVPWTHSRLAFTSGYGAGVDSPGWYHHLFTARDHVVARWLTDVARVLRRHDLAVSAAHVVEAVRLAETLAAVRNRPLAGLAEVTDATLAVLCDGSRVALELVTREAVIGERLGTVPDSAPGVPLEADLRSTARRLRLKFDAEPKDLTLDLRKETDRGRSRLLQRLAILGIEWGTERVVGTIGTFKEGWELAWQPELAVRIIEASLWGTTVERAATAKLLGGTESLAEVTAAVEAALRAELTDALPELLTALDARAAGDTDVDHLLDAFPALARARRYGDVRGTDTTALTGVTDALLARICAGLPPVAGNLGPDAARDLVRRIEAVQTALPLLADPAAMTVWRVTLAGLAGRADVQGLLGGRLVRLLTDSGEIDETESARRLSRALSGGAAADQALWIEGFLAGGALLLIHDDRLLEVLDDWVCALDGEVFVEVLPLLRRTFGDFGPGERRVLAGSVRQLGVHTGLHAPAQDTGDLGRAAAALATLDHILGASSSAH